MLTHIHIKNFIIVKSLSLDFQSGLQVLTGETGAGKSIWIDAIEIGLGCRADAHMIYPNEKSCDITLCFDLQNLTDAKKWLESHDLPNENECIIRRIIDHEKPSRTTINGIPVPQQLVRTFAEHILSIHGQHQHQRLLKSNEQRELLDINAENENLLLSIQTIYEEWKSIDREMQTLKQSIQNKSSDLALWQYQLNELQQLQLQENEYENLFKQFQTLHHGKQFALSLNEALTLIYHENNLNASDLAQQSLHHLNRITLNDSKIENIRTLLQTATIHLNEARNALQQYCYDVDFSADQLEKIEVRLALLQEVARKHHIDPSELPDIKNSLAQKIETLTKADEIITSLENKQKILITLYQEKAHQLTQRREKTAKKLSVDITDFMQQLGMNGGQFNIELQKNNLPIHSYGNEQVNFTIATNPGQTQHELSEIVSGGELSRLSLIIQVLTAQKKNTSTLIFDEVDAGVGGKTADLIGRLLRTLSQQTQVLCVTHLPQVAANGHHHFFAEKITDGKNTSTAIRLLNNSERTQELARMLSGAHITEKSVLYAKELLNMQG